MKKSIKFIRYGNFPDTLISYNWLDNTPERGENFQPGLSVYDAESDKIRRPEFTSRDAITGTATQIGYGSDDEPVIDPLSIVLDDSSKQDDIEVLKEVYNYTTYNQWV